MPINIDFADLNRVQAFLNEVDRRLSDLRPFWNDFAAPAIAGEISEVFLTEGRGEWDDLHPAYAAIKQITHPNKTILRRDDHYIQAATSASHPANIFEATPTEMTWGVDGSWFDFDYPSAHEEGRGRLPQREVFGKLTETGELDENIERLGEKWQREQIAEVERLFG